MEIEEVFPSHLYSIRYDGEKRNEFRRLFQEEWNSKDYLLSFFRKYIDYLDKNIWSHLEKKPEEAAKYVIEDANNLEIFINTLERNVNNGKKPDFDAFFYPLDGKYSYVWDMMPVKGYGRKAHTFLRLYAIKVEANCYIVVYGGLKLGRSIQESPLLKNEVFNRIDRVLRYLKQEGVIDHEDL